MLNLANAYLLRDVARALDCPPYRIVYLLSSRQVPEPTRLGGRRLFTREDVLRIASKLGIEVDTEGENDE